MSGVYRDWSLPSPLVRCAWEVVADSDGTWVDPATEFWGLGFGRTGAGSTAELIGPTARPRAFPIAAGDRFWGVDLHAHVFWRGVAKPAVSDGVLPLPVTDGVVDVGGARFPLPDTDRLQELVSGLVDRGLLVPEPAVERALAGADAPGSARTLRRRVRSVTGLNSQQVAGVQRAREAFELLSEGLPVAEVVHRAGYADQAHLTRSLRALAGRTPRQILRGGPVGRGS